MEWLLILSLCLVGFFVCGCPCACQHCDDFFTRADNTDISVNSPCGWTEQAGTWDIASDDLTTASTSALATMDRTTPNNEAGRVIADFKLPADNDIVRVITDYVDNDNYHFVEFKIHNTPPNGYAKLFERSGGVETELAGDTTVAATVSHDIRIEFCIEQRGLFMGALIWSLTTGSVIARISAALTKHGGDQIGVGTGGTMSGTCIFRRVTLQNACIGGAQCAPLLCNECIDDNTVQTFQVVIDGIVNEDCTACAGLNATYYVERGNLAANDCIYQLAISPAICVNVPFGATGFTQAQINLSSGATSSGMSFQLQNQFGFGQQYIEWQITDLSLIDCDELVDFDLPIKEDHTICDGSASTCTVTSV